MRFLFCLFLIMFGFGGDAFGQRPFQSHLSKLYQSNEELGILPLQNGDFVTEHIPGFYLISYFDRCHNVIWNTSIPNTTYGNCETCAKLISTTDSGFIFTHILKDYNVFPIITKIDKNEKLVWSKKIFINNKPSLGGSGAYGCISTDDSGLFHISNNYDPLIGYADILSRIDADGNIIWSKSLGQFLVSGKILKMPPNRTEIFL